MGSLVSIFFLQSWLVYSDPAGRATPPLSPLAAQGRQIWHDRNCQSCHQIYGFGGFLGPDLTNSAERLTDARLDTVLTVGAGQMPAFDLGDSERRALKQFLEEVHATGVGQLPPILSFDAPTVLAAAVAKAVADGAGLSPDAERGQAVLVAQKCIGCHLPNPVTEKKGTDLTHLVKKLGAGGVRGILAAGIPAKGMPRFDLPRDEQDALLAFLAWLGKNAESIHATFAEAAPKEKDSPGLPWFEYE